MTRSGELRDEDLLAYLDGEAEPEVIQRIEADSQVRVRLEALRKQQQGLKRGLGALRRPSSQQLAEYQLGLLSRTEAREVEEYLRRHPHAARQMEGLEAFLREVSPPAPVEALGLAERAKVLIAELVSGRGGRLQPALGLRGEPVGIYQAGEVQVVLEGDEDAEHPGRRILTGILVGAAPAGLEAQLLRADAEAAGSAPLDEFGNFSMNDLQPGAYTLIIRGGEPPLEIHIASITL